MKGGHILWVVERDKAVKACLSNQALSIGTTGSTTPVDMWITKIASIEVSILHQAGFQLTNQQVIICTVFKIFHRDL